MRVISGITVDGNVLGGFIIAYQSVLVEGAVVLGAVAHVRLHQHADDSTGLLVHGNGDCAVLEGNNLSVPQASDAALAAVRLNVVVLLE